METPKESSEIDDEKPKPQIKQSMEMPKKFTKNGIPIVPICSFLGPNALAPDLEVLLQSVNPEKICLRKNLCDKPENLEEDKSKESDDTETILPLKSLCSIIPPSQAWQQQEHLIVNDNTYLTEEIWTHLLLTNERADGLIGIGTTIFKVHMACLRIFCKYFINYPYTVAFRFDEDVVPADGFEAAYDWMRTKTYELDAADFVDMYQVARQLRIPELREDLERILVGDVLYDRYAYINFTKAQRFQTLNAVRHLLIGRLHRYVIFLVSQGNFRMIDKELMQTMISSDFCGVNTEVEIFYILLLWVNSDFDKHNVYMEKLLKFIRFGNMPTPFLEYLLECFAHKSDDSNLNNWALQIFFTKHTRNIQLVQDAITFASIRNIIARKDLLEECKRIDIPYYEQRYYASDPFCPYHGKINKNGYPLFDEFIKYLESMANKSDNYPQNMKSTLDEKYIITRKGTVHQTVKRKKIKS